MVRQFAIVILVVAFGFTSGTAPAPVGAQSTQTSIVGVVRDAQTGNPIANARVSALDRATVTDARGEFVIANLVIRAPHELVTIFVAASGFGAWTLRDAMLYPGIPRTLTIYLSAQDETLNAGLPRALTSDFFDPVPSPSQRMPRYFSHDVPPPTIKVGITNYASCGDWLAAGKPVIRVDTLDFKTYVKNVLPNEWYAVWGNDAPDSLRAGAMAVKMFAWWRVNLGGVRPLGAEVVDNTCDQRYIPNSNDPRTDAAIDETWDYLMRRDGQVVEIHYLATVAQCQSSPYSPCLPQWGTYYDALAGLGWQSILRGYYSSLQILPAWFYLPFVTR